MATRELVLVVQLDSKAATAIGPKLEFASVRVVGSVSSLWMSGPWIRTSQCSWCCHLALIQQILSIELTLYLFL